ncbi:MAG: LD-carboxypeptidase [Lachnospiraceae bacterium]|nr:LD-carboxypeptidase [Lachnospiraceae bacterium]
MITTGSKIGIVCCSNGQKKEYSEKIRRLEEILRTIGLQPVFSDYIYAKEDVFSGTAKERARSLMDFYRDDEIKGIFDISGGDIANGILPYLDYDVIAGSDKTFWGYSDLTTVINAIYTKTGKASVLYQIRNVLYDHGAQQIEDFGNTVINHTDDLFRIDYRFISSDSATWREDTEWGAVHGIVVGGNIRCFLKLAGTEYMPELTDKILLLEGYTGTAAKMETYLCQLEQLGAFQKVAGILLGTFTEMQEKNAVPDIETLVRKFAGNDLPIAVTGQIGHGTDAKGIWIGRELRLGTC